MTTTTTVTRATAQAELERAWAAMPAHFVLLHPLPQVRDEHQWRVWVDRVSIGCQRQVAVSVGTKAALATCRPRDPGEEAELDGYADCARRLLAALDAATSALGWK